MAAYSKKRSTDYAAQEREIAEKVAAYEQEIAASGLCFPDTWQLMTKVRAVRRDWTQAQIDDAEAVLIWYRHTRDEHAARRIADDADFEERWNETLKHHWKADGFHT